MSSTVCPESGSTTMPDETTARLVSLLEAVTSLRKDVAAGGRSLYRGWQPRIDRQAFAASALNFGHYLALRRLDLRELQHRLMGLGLSSIGRCEGRVLTTLDAIHWALTRMLARASGDPPSERQFFRGEQRLRGTRPSCSGHRATAASGASW